MPTIDIASPLLIINPSSQDSSGREAAQLIRSAEYSPPLASQTIWNLTKVSQKEDAPTLPGRPRNKHKAWIRLRFLRGTPQKRGNVQIVRRRRIFLVDDLVDGGTRRFLWNFLRLHNHLLVAPSLPCL